MSEFNNRYKFLNREEESLFGKLYDEKRKDEFISFSDFREIAVNQINFSKTLIYEVVDSLKKVKDRLGNSQENIINICK